MLSVTSTYFNILKKIKLKLQFDTYQMLWMTMNQENSRFILHCNRIVFVFVTAKLFSIFFTSCFLSIEMKNMKILELFIICWVRSMLRIHFLNKMSAIVKTCCFEIATSAKTKCCLYVKVIASIMSYFFSFSLFLFLLSTLNFLLNFLLLKSSLSSLSRLRFLSLLLSLSLSLFLFLILSAKNFS